MIIHKEKSITRKIKTIISQESYECEVCHKLHSTKKFAEHCEKRKIERVRMYYIENGFFCDWSVGDVGLFCKDGSFTPCKIFDETKNTHRIIPIFDIEQRPFSEYDRYYSDWKRVLLFNPENKQRLLELMEASE